MTESVSDELVARLHRDPDAVGDGIVLGVARLSADLDGPARRGRGHIDDELLLPVFVGHEQLVRVRCVRQPVRKSAARNASEHPPVAAIEDRDFMACAESSEHPL